MTKKQRCSFIRSVNFSVIIWAKLTYLLPFPNSCPIRINCILFAFHIIIIIINFWCVLRSNRQYSRLFPNSVLIDHYWQCSVILYAAPEIKLGLVLWKVSISILVLYIWSQQFFSIISSTYNSLAENQAVILYLEKSGKPFLLWNLWALETEEITCKSLFSILHWEEKMESWRQDFRTHCQRPSIYQCLGGSDVMLCARSSV